MSHFFLNSSTSFCFLMVHQLKCLLSSKPGSTLEEQTETTSTGGFWSTPKCSSFIWIWKGGGTWWVLPSRIIFTARSWHSGAHTRRRWINCIFKKNLSLLVLKWKEKKDFKVLAFSRINIVLFSSSHNWWNHWKKKKAMMS